MVSAAGSWRWRSFGARGPERILASGGTFRRPCRLAVRRATGGPVVEGRTGVLLRSRRSAAVPVVVLLAVAAPPTAVAAARPPNPCALLTNAQVARTLGYRVAERAAGGTPLVRTCTWTGPPMGYSGSRPSLVVMSSRLTRKAFEKGEPGGRVPHLGGAAYAVLSPIDELGVWQHGVALTFIFQLATPTLGATTRLARAALGRL